MVEFSPREKFREVKEIQDHENPSHAEHLSPEKHIEQRVREQEKANLLEQEIAETSEEQTKAPEIFTYESFRTTGSYTVAENPQEKFYEEQQLQKMKEDEERRKRALI